MDEHVHRQYLKEEEFLEEHFQTVDAVLPRIGFAWKPDYRCNDQSRQCRHQLLATGQLQELIFDSAVFFHNRDGLSSIRLYMRSSARFLVARIHWVGADAQVKILADVVPAYPVQMRARTAKIMNADADVGMEEWTV